MADFVRGLSDLSANLNFLNVRYGMGAGTGTAPPPSKKTTTTTTETHTATPAHGEKYGTGPMAGKKIGSFVRKDSSTWTSESTDALAGRRIKEAYCISECKKNYAGSMRQLPCINRCREETVNEAKKDIGKLDFAMRLKQPSVTMSMSKGTGSKINIPALQSVTKCQRTIHTQAEIEAELTTAKTKSADAYKELLLKMITEALKMEILCPGTTPQYVWDVLGTQLANTFPGKDLKTKFPELFVEPQATNVTETATEDIDVTVVPPPDVPMDQVAEVIASEASFFDRIPTWGKIAGAAAGLMILGKLLFR